MSAIRPVVPVTSGRCEKAGSSERTGQGYRRGEVPHLCSDKSFPAPSGIPAGPPKSQDGEDTSFLTNIEGVSLSISDPCCNREVNICSGAGPSCMKINHSIRATDPVISLKLLVFQAIGAMTPEVGIDIALHFS